MADFEHRIKELETKLNGMRQQFDNIVMAYADARDFTQNFLKCCSKHHVNVVAIQAKTDLIEESVSFPFGVSGSVFANGNDKEGWPVIWRICGEAGVSGACGNHNQNSLNEIGKAKLIDGVYKFENGKWMRLYE